ncbi:hypothetical protein ACIRUY_32315 [Streptomyces erythrochromogenes]|uniref:hypothetical protein n=1 Tax=Streptomyces erythrochromogenes TaxID=285574 RepID=UPI003830B65C
MSSARTSIALCLSAAALLAGGTSAVSAAAAPSQGPASFAAGPAECMADTRDMQDLAKAVRADARARDAAATSASNVLLGQQVVEAEASCTGITAEITAKVDEIARAQESIGELLAAVPTVTDEVLALAVSIPSKLVDLVALLRAVPAAAPVTH